MFQQFHKHRPIWYRFDGVIENYLFVIDFKCNIISKKIECSKVYASLTKLNSFDEGTPIDG